MELNKINYRFVREPEVRKLAGGISRTTLWRWVNSGIFPRPLRLGPNTKAWRESDLAKWSLNFENAKERVIP